MQFPTLQFAAFFVLVFALSWLLVPLPRGRKVFLLAASYFFYACADWNLSFLLAASTLINWAGATLIGHSLAAGDRKTARRWLVLGVFLDLGMLIWFKYTGLGIQGFNALSSLAGLPVQIPYLSILLPVGISFFTFQGLSLLMDVWKGDLEKAPGLLDAFLFKSFFPQLVAGPIVRAKVFLPQLAVRPDPATIPLARASTLIFGGLIKKIALAGPLGTLLVDPVFANPDAFGSVDILFAILGYGAQIYCDFSAYSDLAIGLALLLGYSFPPNFDDPYRARSLGEFWRRWHISLSTWLRDYLYIPLGGNRHGLMRTCINLMVTMVLGGLWHGAQVTFLLWGALHGLGLVGERLLSGGGNKVRKVDPAAARVLPERTGQAGPAGGTGQSGQASGTGLTPGSGHTSVAGQVVPQDFAPAQARTVAGFLRSLSGWLVTFVLVQAAWVFFRAESLDQAVAVFAGLGRNAEPSTLLSPLLVCLVVLPYLIQLLPRALKQAGRDLTCRLPQPVLAAGAAVCALVLAVTAQEGMAGFIYFRF